MGALQDGARCDRALTAALFADILTPSVKPVAAIPSTLRADKSFRPALLIQELLTGFICLEPLPKLLEAHLFLLTHISPPFPDAAILPLLQSHIPELYLGTG